MKYTGLILLLFTLTTCKKKTSVKVKVYNYALDEPIANATVALVEKKGESGGGIFAGSAKCHEIASLVTDANGECSFDKEKLKTAGKYSYFLAITDAYDMPQSYPCGGKTSGFLVKGKSQDVILNASYFDGYIQVKYNDLLNPSQNGDSLVVSISMVKYNVPGGSYPQGGGGVLYSVATQGSFEYPFPNIFYSNEIKTKASKHIVEMRKRKMGVLTTAADTVKVYPNQTTVVQINW